MSLKTSAQTHAVVILGLGMSEPNGGATMFANSGVGVDAEDRDNAARPEAMQEPAKRPPESRLSWE
eukprot:5326532-Alexandrium_andersonii.AAC.1